MHAWVHVFGMHEVRGSQGIRGIGFLFWGASQFLEPVGSWGASGKLEGEITSILRCRRCTGTMGS